MVRDNIQLNIKIPHEDEAGKIDDHVVSSEWGEKTIVLGLKIHGVAVSILFAL